MPKKKKTAQDSPSLTRADIAAMRPVRDVMPDLIKTMHAERTRRGRPAKAKDVLKKPVSLRLDPDVIDALDQLEGRRNTLINAILRDHLAHIGAL